MNASDKSRPGIEDSSSHAEQRPIQTQKANENKAIDKLHRFNPWVAEHYGLTEAVIYQYVAWLIATQKSASPGLNKLQNILPYLGRDQVWRALEKLSVDDGGSPELLRRKRSGNRFVYRLGFPPEKKTPHSFDPEMAKKYGLPAAVLYDDFARWIIGNDIDERHLNGDTPYHYETARRWASVHPYIPLRTVERCLRKLQDAGELIHAFDPLAGGQYYHVKDGVRSPVWTIPFGIGKVDRWNDLHRDKKSSEKKNPKKKKPVVLYDADTAD